MTPLRFSGSTIFPEGDSIDKITATIEFFSYWQAGSGEGLRPDIDALALRDPDGFPYFPGRTIKGIWREAMQSAEDAGMIKKSPTARLFGEHSACNETDEPPRKGLLSFSNAEMDSNFREWLHTQGREARQQMFRHLSGTSLEDGVAMDQTQRTIEVCLPLTMCCEITCENPQDMNSWHRCLYETAGLIKSLGYRRHRGLGRCRVTVPHYHQR